MSRLWWRLLVALLLLPIVAVTLMPFTDWGSRLVLTNAGRMLPLDIEYGAGTLAGELQLRRLAWASDTLRLELEGLVMELEPGCLWRSAICFRQLDARRLFISVLPDVAGEPGPDQADADNAMFEFPVPLDAPSVYLDALSVRWQGGEWRQGKLEGSVAISGSTVRVGRTRLQQARLELAGDSGSDGPVELPEISLPLELRR